jgi:hypothetical protein
VEVTGMTFLGDAARTKKQAEKNAAMAAWSALKQRKRRINSFSLAVAVADHVIAAAVGAVICDPSSQVLYLIFFCNESALWAVLLQL